MAVTKELMQKLVALEGDLNRLREETGYKYESGCGPVPVPDFIRKAENFPYNESNCERVVAGKTRIVGEMEYRTGKAKEEEGTLLFTYPNFANERVVKLPEPKKSLEPPLPNVERIAHCGMKTIVSGIVLAAVILLTVIYAFCATIPFGEILLFFDLILLWGVFVPLVIITRGEVFGMIKKIFRLSKIKQANSEEMVHYAERMEGYIRATANAEAEYQAAMQKYEADVAAAKGEREADLAELKKRANAALAAYSEACRGYFAKKAEIHAQYEADLVEAEKRYRAVAARVAAYPEEIPFKYRNVPAFEDASPGTLSRLADELHAVIDILGGGRADTFKEAINCYVADCQAEEQRRTLEEQAAEQRRAAEEQRRILEEQAEDQRRAAEEQNRILERQAEDQRRAAEDQRRAAAEQNRILERQAEEQKRDAMRRNEAAERQACAASVCITCKHNGSMTCRFKGNGRGGCIHYYRK